MRRIMEMVMEFALEDNKQDNERCETIREVYNYYDRELSNANGSHPVKVSEALVVGDFPLYFSHTLSRMVMDRYTYKMGSWRDYTYADTLPNYNSGQRFRFSEFDTMEKRREKQEAYSGYIFESRWLVSVDDYAKQVDFSNRILVNDDLGQFNNFGLLLGDSSRRFEDFFVSAYYDNAVTQAALIALGANYAGTGRLTTANLAIAWNAFAQRVDARGNMINVTPTYLVIPPVLELTANQILMSERIAELATNGINPLQGRLQVRVDPYITFTSPNIPWYLFAAPSDIPAVTVARMDGRPGPRLWAKAPDKIPMSASGSLGAANWRDGSFLSGDIELMVETTIGGRNDATGTLVGVTDAQGIYYSSGTTP